MFDFFSVFLLFLGLWSSRELSSKYEPHCEQCMEESKSWGLRVCALEACKAERLGEIGRRANGKALWNFVVAEEVIALISHGCLNLL